MGQYSVIFLFVAICAILGLVLYTAPNILVRKYLDTEKLSPYECGFDPFSDTKDPFEVGFYVVSILFIIFDLEVSFLFPWALVFLYLGFHGFMSMFIFLLVLTLGFVYEWQSGALDWLIIVKILLVLFIL